MIKKINIKDDSISISMTTAPGTTLTITSDRICRSEFGDAVKGLAKVAAETIKHDADLMSVRSVIVSENKKGVEFVKLAGVLAVPSKDGQTKPGKFTTPKIEIGLLVKDAMSLMTKEAKVYAEDAMAAK